MARFQPGISGNPGGRPKRETREMSAYAREFGVAGISMLAEMAGLKPGGKLAEPDTARVAAIRELLDRGFGKATQLITGDPERPLAVEFSWAPAASVAVAHETTPAPPVIDATPEPASTDTEFVWGKSSDDTA
jgi:hypothetical protein